MIILDRWNFESFDGRVDFFFLFIFIYFASHTLLKKCVYV